MADNTTLDAGSGGDTIGTDDISGVKYPRSKIIIGADGTNDGDVSAANPLPVTGTITAVTDITNAVTVDNAGTFAVQVDGAALTALQLLDNAIYVDDADWTDSTSSHVLTGGVYQSSPQAITDGDVGPFQVTANGYMITSINGTVTVDLGANNDVTLATLPDTAAGDLAAMVVDLAAIEVLLGTIDADTSKITACNTGAVVLSSGTVTTVSTVTNLSQLGGSAIAMNAGVLSAGTQRVTIATDDEVNNLLGTIDADTSTLAGAVTGTEMQCDIVAELPAGTQAIGKLAANSGVDIGDVDVTSIAAGTNTIGGTIAQISTSAAYDGTTALTIKRASGVAASGTTAIVSAVAGKKFRVLAFAAFATSATATNIYLATTTDTDVLGNSGNPIPVAVDADGDNVAGFVLPWNPGGWTETSTANEDLNLILSAAQDVIYAITYVEVD